VKTTDKFDIHMSVHRKYNSKIQPKRCNVSWFTSVHYTTSCKHGLVLLRMGEIIVRNMLSWLELWINRYCCI